MIHEAILKRLPAIQQLCAGLESLQFLQLVRQVPSVFETIFVYKEQELTPEKVISMLVFPAELTNKGKLNESFLQRYVQEATLVGMFIAAIPT